MATKTRSASAATARFVIPKFTDAQLSNPVFSRSQINDLGSKIQQRDVALAERDKQVVALNGEAARLQVRLDVANAELAKRDTTIAASQRQIGDLLSANADLKKQLELATVNRPKIRVDDLVRQISDSIEQLNSEARKAAGTSFLVDNLQVEIKSGIDVSDGLRLSQLPESALGVESASTLRFALKPSAVIRIVDDEAPPTPA